jgi:integrase
MTEKRKWSVKIGSVTVWIRLQRPTKDDQKYRCYTLDYSEDGCRMRPSFGTLKQAKKEAKTVAQRLSRGDTGNLVLQGNARLEYSRSLESLAPVGVSLDVAAADFARATQVLNGKGSLLDAARYFALTHGADMRPIRVGELVHDLIRTREGNYASKRHLQDLRSRLRRFADAFQCEIHLVRPAQIQDFLTGLRLSPRSVNNFRMAISNLFAHARLRNHTPKDFDPVENIPKAKEADGEVEIYSTDELNSLLASARTEMVPYLAIAAFSGLRQAELSRLNSTEVKDDHIFVLGGNTKTGRHRQVPILPNLAAWLRPYRQESGLIVPFKNVTNQLCKLLRECEIESKHNGLRHSFGSHRLAILKDPAKVAYEMGNTPAMVFRHYRKVVTEMEASRWFGLYPDAKGKPTFVIQTQIQPAVPIAA